MRLELLGASAAYANRSRALQGATRRSGGGTTTQSLKNALASGGIAAASHGQVPRARSRAYVDVVPCQPNDCRFSRSEAPASLRAERHAALPDFFQPVCKRRDAVPLGMAEAARPPGAVNGPLTAASSS